jgi:aryl-alcohol dehydrogenase-like predicted oxidoreductase
MQALIQEGKVRYGGLSNHTTELMQRAMTIAPITDVIAKVVEREKAAHHFVDKCDSCLLTNNLALLAEARIQ